MSNDKEFRLLHQKYLLCTERIHQLEEELEQKQAQWKKRDADFSVTERIVRELCEKILSKDHQQMVLGKEHTWSSTPINVLVTQAKAVYDAYNKERTEMMRTIMDVSEERLAQITDLQDEIVFLKTRAGSAVKPSDDELEKAIKKEKDKKTVDTTALSPKAQQAQKDGSIHFVAQKVKEDIKNGKAVAVYEEEDEEDLAGDMLSALKAKGIKDNLTAKKTTTNSIPSVHTPKQNKQNKKQKDEITNAFMNEKYSELEKKLDDGTHWVIIKVLGDTGVSLISKIIPLVTDELSKTNHKMISERLMRSKITELCQMGIVRKEELTLSNHGKVHVCELSRDGVNLYYRKYDKAANDSEMTKVIAEHTSLAHGYGILDCAEVIEESGFFKSVNVWNRKNPITIPNTDMQFIPDIKCIDENDSVTYLEYEIGTYSQRDFNGRFNKQFRMVEKANILCPNKATCEKIIQMIEKYYETKSDSEHARMHYFRITPATQIKGIDLRKDKNWMYIYKYGMDAPIKNF